MATLAIRRATWDGLASNQRQIMRLMVKRLALGRPALYDDAGTEHWVFDDWRFNLDHFANLGALAKVISGLPAGWTPPTIQAVDENGDPFDTGRVDRAAVEAEATARVVATVVSPADITYADDDPNPYQTTLDANAAPAAMTGWGAVPASWSPVGAP